MEKKWLWKKKRVVPFIGLIVFLMVAAVICFLILLPDPNKIGTSEVLQPVIKKPTMHDLPMPRASDGTAAEKKEWDSYPPESQRRDAIANGYLLRRVFADEQNPDPCKYLEHVRDLKEYKGYFLKDEIVDVVKGLKKGDPFVELILGPLKQLMLETRLGRVAALWRSLDKKGSISFYQKARFYNEMVFAIPGAISDFISKKERIEDSLDHAYLTFSFFSLFRDHPDFFENSESLSICRFLNDPEISLSEKKKEFESTLRSLGVEFKSIGYDPDYKSKLSIERKDALELKIRGCWLDVFKIL